MQPDRIEIFVDVLSDFPSSPLFRVEVNTQTTTIHFTTSSCLQVSKPLDDWTFSKIFGIFEPISIPDCDNQSDNRHK